MVTLAINGFGRIGRVAARILLERKRLDRLVAVNDLTDTATLAHLLKYDTNYGILSEEIRAVDPPSPHATSGLRVGHHVFGVLAEKEPANLPWKELGVEVVIESTGRFTEREAAAAHLAAGAKQVIISAPSQGANPAPTSLIGVNAGENDAPIINNASCTTNCIAPMIAVLKEKFGVEQALMTTIHAYTAEENLVDGPPPGLKGGDLRRARAAPMSIIPTTTGAAIATTQAIPALAEKFDGVAVRVPIEVGSLSDVTAVLSRSVSVEEINHAFEAAAQQPKYAGIIATTHDPIVSADIVGRSESVILDLSLTKVVGGTLVKIFGWYDNEWGYANRLIDQALRLAGDLDNNS